MVKRASWFAWKVVKARVVATSATTRALAKSRIFWVSPIAAPLLVFLVPGVVLAELVLVGDALERGCVQGERRLDVALGGNRDLARGLVGALVPGLERVLAGGDAGDGESAVRSRPREGGGGAPHHHPAPP